MTPDEFLTWETDRPERWEFIDGKAVMKVGGSDVHNVIGMNTVLALRNAFKATPCTVFMFDVRLLLAEAGALFSPDVFVTCSDADRERRQLKEDPVLIAEVLSPSTEAHDRGGKFAAYRRFPGLKTVLFLSQGRAHVECYSRTAEGDWLLTEAGGDAASLALPEFGFTLALAELYQDLPANPA
ncbi:Uma2 family endonuclease [Thauera sp.]|uniref:Uma2 family endonuclease n=1 Tax=Thauera sp. TaxID=1905334 RepID=UPI0039E47837